MKRLKLLMITAAFLTGFSAIGQNPGGQAQGQGRGGAPHAWGDKDKDGKCDITGQPVGQGRGGRMMGRRQGMRGGRAMMGRGMGACCRNNAAPPDAKSATPPPASK